MEICHTKSKNINEVMRIIEDAKELLKLTTKVQWQNGYPNEETIINDIKRNESYVMVEENQVVGTACISLEKDINYSKIYDGEWFSDDKYVVIHRLASKKGFHKKGIGKSFINYAITIAKQNNFKSVRVDTHPNNLSMNNLLVKMGFTKKGIIFVDPKQTDDSLRYAYELLV